LRLLLNYYTGGSWDNSDVSSAKKKKWNDDDKKYTASSSPTKLDWSGKSQRRGPVQRKAGPAKAEPPKKKLFGLF
jgi:hypothetical protein